MQEVRSTLFVLSFISIYYCFASLIHGYKAHAKCLQVTGDGVEAPEQASEASDNPAEFMEFYVGPAGPDESAPEKCVNLWSMYISFPVLSPIFLHYNQRKLRRNSSSFHGCMPCLQPSLMSILQ